MPHIFLLPQLKPFIRRPACEGLRPNGRETTELGDDLGLNQRASDVVAVQDEGDSATSTAQGAAAIRATEFYEVVLRDRWSHAGEPQLGEQAPRADRAAQLHNPARAGRQDCGRWTVRHGRSSERPEAAMSLTLARGSGTHTSVAHTEPNR